MLSFLRLLLRPQFNDYLVGRERKPYILVFFVSLGRYIKENHLWLLDERPFELDSLGCFEAEHLGFLQAPLLLRHFLPLTSPSLIYFGGLLRVKLLNQRSSTCCSSRGSSRLQLEVGLIFIGISLEPDPI